MRIQLAHGLEGSPRGRKARALAEAFDLLVPAMDTGDFEACVRLHSEACAMWGPEVLVGSSFGGAVATALLQRGLWRGPTLLLATASRRRGLPPALPAGVPVRLVHARQDDVVPVSDAREIAATSDPAWVTLLEVDDDHALTRHPENDALLAWVRDLAALNPLTGAATLR